KPPRARAAPSMAERALHVERSSRSRTSRRPDRRPSMYNSPPAGVRTGHVSTGVRTHISPPRRIHGPPPRIPVALRRSPAPLRRIPVALPRSPVALRRSPVALRRIPFALSRIPAALRRIPFALRRRDEIVQNQEL